MSSWCHDFFYQYRNAQVFYTGKKIYTGKKDTEGALALTRPSTEDAKHASKQTLKAKI